MKVRCIDDIGANYLTKGKIYNVSFKDDKDYEIEDDSEEYIYYPKERFEIVEDTTDMVNHPSHYTQGKFECIEVIEEITKSCSKFEAYLTGTILKYLWRWKFKNGLEDLKKARWYLDKLIEKVEEKENENN